MVGKVWLRWRSRELKSGCGKRKPLSEQVYDSDPQQLDAKSSSSGAGLRGFQGTLLPNFSSWGPGLQRQVIGGVHAAKPKTCRMP